MSKIFFNKKGQVIGQIFIFIMAALIIGVIVLIGYNAISKTLSKGCQVEQLSFKTKLESLIEQYNGYGTIKKQSLIAPCEYEIVCFVDVTEIGKSNPLPLCNDNIIKKSVKDGDLKNIFVSNQKKTIPIGYSSMLRTDNPSNCTCVKQKNKNFNLKFIGIGIGTIVRDENYIGQSNYQTTSMLED
ncbi:MAG: hypothetical protein KatS3mg002_0469 [Candidatus Woesearchaeota archaeon]|nr:MAG: hypothetical protein KatS3mg002_0469 [Candidatus Woesearchaeota archaeon]